MRQTTWICAIILLSLLKVAGVNAQVQDEVIGWQNDCASTKDWYDNKADPSFMAKIEQAEPSVFKVTQSGTDTWGKVAYVVKGVDVDKTPYLEVLITKVDINSAFKVAVSSPDWKEFYEVLPRSSADGAHVANLKEATKWSGVKDFNVILIVEGKDKATWFSNLKISSKKPATK
jgi:hypothetical protein